MVKGTNEMQQKEVLMDQIEEEREKLNLLLDGDEISETAYGQSLIVDQLIEQYTNLDHLTREIVEELIDYILIGKRIPGTRNIPIEIHWNF